MNSKQKKKVEIAKDVLSQLRIEAYVADSVYFSPSNDAGESLEGGYANNETDYLIATGPEMQKFAKNTECSVCAIGAALISGIRLYDGVSGNMFDPDNGAGSQAAQKWFTRADLYDMEGVFEVSKLRLPEMKGFYNPDDLEDAMVEISDDARMRGVFKSIIQLKGKIDTKHMVTTVLHEDKLEKRRKKAAAQV